MRVIAGTFRHRNLLMARDKNIRPTKDVTKEGMFSALGYKVIGANVLDLFAGCGSLGIEAISRGASYAYFVDNNKEAISTIKQNLHLLDIDNSKVIFSHYLKALSNFISDNIKFDIVFLDPPYKENIYNEIVNYLLENNLLNKDAAIVLETDKKLNIENTFSKIKDYKYGKTLVKILWL